MPLDVFGEEYWIGAWGFPRHRISSLGRIWDDEFDEEVSQRLSGGHMVAHFREGAFEFNSQVWRLMCASFWREGWGFDRTVAYRDGNPRNLSIFNILFDDLDGKPLTYRLSEATGLWARRRRNARSVRIVETGEVFDSVAELATHIGGYANTCYMVLRGEQKTTKGYHLEWAED